MRLIDFYSNDIIAANKALHIKKYAWLIAPLAFKSCFGRDDDCAKGYAPRLSSASSPRCPPRLVLAFIKTSKSHNYIVCNKNYIT